jgi:hypothetical protein
MTSPVAHYCETGILRIDDHWKKVSSFKTIRFFAPRKLMPPKLPRKYHNYGLFGEKRRAKS